MMGLGVRLLSDSNLFRECTTSSDPPSIEMDIILLDVAFLGCVVVVITSQIQNINAICFGSITSFIDMIYN